MSRARSDTTSGASAIGAGSTGTSRRRSTGRKRKLSARQRTIPTRISTGQLEAPLRPIAIIAITTMPIIVPRMPATRPVPTASLINYPLDNRTIADLALARHGFTKDSRHG